MYSTIFGVRPGFFPQKKTICKKKKMIVRLFVGEKKNSTMESILKEIQN